MLDGLESILTNPWTPYAYYASSIATDLVFTYLHVCKDGPAAERNLIVRKEIDGNGAESLFTRTLPLQIIGSGILISGMYGIDYMLGIHDSPLNFNKGACYFIGTVKHLLAVRHFARLFDNKYFNLIAEAIERATHNRLGVPMD